MRCKIFSLIALLWLLTTNASESVAPYEEVKRAFSIIEQNQLEIFSNEKPPSINNLLIALNSLLSEADNETAQLDIMRAALSRAIDTYNDQYANYISPESLQRYREKRSGSYHGIGLKFRALADEFPVVIGPLIGGPLQGSDLQPGDKIIEAGGVSLKGKSSSEIVQLMKGPAGTTIDLLLQRGLRRHSVDAKREPVNLEYASAEVIDSNIGYLKISRFGSNTHLKVRALIAELINQSVVGLVLDLRDNPGGSTRAARSITSIFIKHEHIYCERYKSGNRRLLPRHGDYLTDLPLTILVNGGSMSASEIVAGALQSYGRATLIGEPTFGKGLVQKVFNLAPPLGGAIRTTIAEFATPDNQPIHAAGIVPDKFIRTAADFMFRQTGSLNISADARAYQRELLEKRVSTDYPDKASEYISAVDQQLESAINIIRKKQAFK